jgi:hypothetical protein
MTHKARTLIAAFGALVYALYGARILSWSLVSVWIAVRDYAQTASGGLGFVSESVDIFFLPYILLALASIVANVMLRSWVRTSDGTVKALHRTQRWSIVLAFVVMIASVVDFTVGPGPLPFVLVPLSGVVWGAQFVLTAALLGMYALQRSKSF